ncbi:hypothetical protein CTAYLR_000355 [Chrysophaeum taylorii]|uniref:FAD-binding 8 domain-containing protein n=1 Tax=Chrysophaeum taylorii TaxID=2483200 RepID=A0AAD7XLT0_9STRA|nr:hypothetical protein CTAYLR_000355 [Chrysophaeum taylorii]
MLRQSNKTNPMMEETGTIDAARRRPTSCCWWWPFAAWRLPKRVVAPFTTTSQVANALQVVCGACCLFGTVVDLNMYSPYQENNEVSVVRLVWCPRRFTCVDPTSAIQVACLVVSRFSAGAMYAVLALLTASTAHSCSTWLGRRARLRLSGGLFGGAQARHVHVRAGVVFARLSLVHGVAHVVRWLARRELKSAMRAYMAIAGAVAVVAFCAIPWLVTVVRLGVSFETTMKFSHHAVLSVGLVSAMAHHRRLAVVASILAVFWTLDRLHLVLFRSYVIESPHLTACCGSPGGVLVTFPNPRGFCYETGDYVKISFPWLCPQKKGSQWHPFSIAPVGVGALKTKSMLYLQVEGDWTRTVYDHVRRTANGYARPMCLCGPFASPFNSSIMHDYLLLVASGVGITPSLSVLARLGPYRHICVLWMSRDADLVTLYSDYINPKNGLCAEALVHLTGKAAAGNDDNRLDAADNGASVLRITRGRPDVEAVTRRILANGTGSFFVSATDLEVDPGSNGIVVDAAGPPPPPEDATTEGWVTTKKRRLCGGGGGGGLAPPMLRGSDESASSVTSVPMMMMMAPVPPPSPVPKLSTKQRHSQRRVASEPIEPREWKVLYCGGSKAIQDILARVSLETGAAFDNQARVALSGGRRAGARGSRSRRIESSPKPASGSFREGPKASKGDWSTPKNRRRFRRTGNNSNPEAILTASRRPRTSSRPTPRTWISTSPGVAYKSRRVPLPVAAVIARSSLSTA